MLDSNIKSIFSLRERFEVFNTLVRNKGIFIKEKPFILSHLRGKLDQPIILNHLEFLKSIDLVKL